eukprot:s219_g14.t1
MPMPQVMSDNKENMTVQVSETWQDKVKAGFEHGLAMVQEKAQAGYEATRERVSTARAGQELLDKGGAAAEDAIRAKVTSDFHLRFNTELASHPVLEKIHPEADGSRALPSDSKHCLIVSSWGSVWTLPPAEC